RGRPRGRPADGRLETRSAGSSASRRDRARAPRRTPPQYPRRPPRSSRGVPDPRRQLLQAADAASPPGKPVLAIEEEGRQTGADGPLVVLDQGVPDVEGLRRGNAEPGA